MVTKTTCPDCKGTKQVGVIVKEWCQTCDGSGILISQTNFEVQRAAEQGRCRWTCPYEDKSKRKEWLSGWDKTHEQELAEIAYGDY